MRIIHYCPFYMCSYADYIRVCDRLKFCIFVDTLVRTWLDVKQLAICKINFINYVSTELITLGVKELNINIYLYIYIIAGKKSLSWQLASCVVRANKRQKTKQKCQTWLKTDSKSKRRKNFLRNSGCRRC